MLFLKNHIAFCSPRVLDHLETIQGIFSGLDDDFVRQFDPQVDFEPQMINFIFVNENFASAMQGQTDYDSRTLYEALTIFF